MRQIVFVLSSLFVLVASLASAAYNPNVTARERAFAASVQSAIKRDDANWIAQNVRYPIKVCVGAELRTIKDKAEFLREYGLIVDDRVRKDVGAADLNFLMKNFQGVLLGGGVILIYDGGEAAPASSKPQEQQQQKLTLNVTPDQTLEAGHPQIVAIHNGSVDNRSRQAKCI
jgi:hypothetical protein